MNSSPGTQILTAGKAGGIVWLAPSLVVLFVALAVYSNALPNGFVVDDRHQIVENPWITDVRYIPEVLSTGVWEFEGRYSSYYRPLMHGLYMATYHVVGLKPWGYHFVNILLHALTSVLVVLITSRILGSAPVTSGLRMGPPLIAGLLFATHPIHTESVSWVSGITDVSFAFFYLLSFFLYIRSDSWVSRTLSVSSFFLATLCKEPAVTLPAVLLAYDWLFKHRSSALSYYVKSYAPYLAAVVFYVALRANALGGLAPTSADLGFGPYVYVSNVLLLFALYLAKLVFPVGLNIWNVFDPIDSLVSMRGAISFLVAACFLTAVLVTAKKNKEACLGLLFIIVPLLPTFWVSALNQGLENALAERYLYLPSFGFVLLLAWFLSRAAARKPRWTVALTLVTVVLLGTYTVGTVRRNFVWRSSLSLWEDAVGKSPGSGVAHLQYASALLYAKRMEEGRKQLQIAVDLDPGLVDNIIGVGVAYGEKGLTKRAILKFHTALALKPDSARAHYNLALAYDDKGWTDQAVQHYETTLKLDPRQAEAHNNLGIIYATRAQMDRALVHFETAARLRPDDPEFRANLSRAKGL